MGGNNEFFENFERIKYLKKLPSMQRVKAIRCANRLRINAHKRRGSSWGTTGN